MCYGQTGAGKTFTMTGATESYQHRGLIPRAISQLFKQIEDRLEYSITVRYNNLVYNMVIVGRFLGHIILEDVLGCHQDL